MKKEFRETIYNKFGGRCAYTGAPLPSDWQVDHIRPLYHYQWSWMDHLVYRRDDSILHIDNMFPSLKIVNHYKRSRTLEEFRTYLSTLHFRLKRYPKNPGKPYTIKRKAYIMEIAAHFGISIDQPFSGKFYFETIINPHEGIKS